MLAAIDRKGKMKIEEGEGTKTTVKAEKEGKRKAMAGREFNWGMLYMNVRVTDTNTNVFSFVLMQFCISLCSLTL